MSASPHHSPVHRPRHQHRTQRLITIMVVTLAAAGAALLITWSPTLGGTLIASTLLLAAVGTIATAGEALSAQWHWALDSRHRIRDGKAEWFDLHAYLHRPRWRWTTTKLDRALLIHCARPFEQGGRGTNTPMALLRWLQAGEDLTLLKQALARGASDAELDAHLRGEKPIERRPA